jgi:hypothetical protein
MSNESKNAIVNERDGSGKNDPNRPKDTAQKTGQPSQDASRHQQDSAHHQNEKNRQQGASDHKVGQQSQGGSHKDSG